MNAAQARLEPRDRFIESAVHPQLRHETGTEEMARRLAAAMNESVKVVERAHRKRFREPPQVYVCDADCFVRFSTMQRTVPAAHFMDAIFMNDLVLRQKEKQFDMPAEKFLVHELTHLFFYQYAGAFSYMGTPAWFREGWAVLVSGGAGAEACTPAQAVAQLQENLAFDPSEQGSIFQNRTASSYGLRYPVFYRQAGMFVDYLQQLDHAAFHSALNSLFAGNDFQDSFEQAYGKPIASFWPAFRESAMRLVAEKYAP